jgi:hypothetical protein
LITLVDGACEGVVRRLPALPFPIGDTSPLMPAQECDLFCAARAVRLSSADLSEQFLDIVTHAARFFRPDL